MAPLLLLLLLLLLLRSAVVSPEQTVPMTDSLALILLKDSFTNTTALSSWSPTSTAPCDDRSNWAGVICFDGIVTGLHLAGMGLSGAVDVTALAHFKGLRTVSFVDNAFSGPIPTLNTLSALKSIYLSNNHFSGEIPDGFFSDMTHLKKLWLDGNKFTGAIPSSLSKATHLIELRLEDNLFTGPIPDLKIPSLKSFNVSNNDVEGLVPASFARFKASAFQGNPKLCGPQPGPGTCNDSPPLSRAKGEEPGKLSAAVITLVVLLVVLLSVCVIIRKRRRAEEVFGSVRVNDGVAVAALEVAVPPLADAQYGSSKKRPGSSKGGSGSRHSSKGGEGPSPELVMVSEEKGVFGLPDLMKAAAEVLGNGGLGSAYKAVMANGATVVVKRMREMNRVGKDVFDAELRRLGRLRHPNVLNPLAYHYRREEKLVVFEFIQKGSLSFVLHGDKGPDHAALDWPARLKIVRGIARGTAYLHAELGSLDVPHGNLMSANVLLGPGFEPLVADYGYAGLVNPSQASVALFAYRSPEAVQYREVSPKSDVYCLGIIILELLTGKFPSQYLNNTKGGTDVVQWVASAILEGREAELLDPDIVGVRSAVPDMVRLLQFGSACTDAKSEQRPEMRDVVVMVEEIAAAAGVGEEGGLGEEETAVSLMDSVR